MKKSTLFTSFLLLSLIFLNACSKKDQLGPVIDPPEQNPAAPLSVTLFDELNETVARFDPLYLQIVYKDNRSTQGIQEEATRLLMAFQQDPTSPVIQKELADLYHFKSFTELQKASNIITQNSTALKKGLLGKDSLLSKEKLHQLTEARKAFIKNKMISLEKASQKSSSGLWADNAAWILDHYHYYSQIGNLEMGLDMDGAVGIECNDSCCYELQSCKINANNNFLLNIFKFGESGATAVSLTAGAIGSVIPVFGTFLGLASGAVVGGINGVIVANLYHNNELQICYFNYKACLEKKKQN